MKQWKYDDNACLGQDDSSSSGKHNHDDGKHTHDKPSTTTHDHDKGGEANVAANSPSRGVTPQSNNSNTQPIAAGLSVVLLVAIAVVGTLAFFIIRKSRGSNNRQSWETSISRQSELGNSNNDLELQANDGYEDEERSVDYAPPMSSFA